MNARLQAIAGILRQTGDIGKVSQNHFTREFTRFSRACSWRNLPKLSQNSLCQGAAMRFAYHAARQQSSQLRSRAEAQRSQSILAGNKLERSEAFPVCFLCVPCASAREILTLPVGAHKNATKLPRNCAKIRRNVSQPKLAIAREFSDKHASHVCNFRRNFVTHSRYWKSVTKLIRSRIYEAFARTTWRICQQV